MPNVTLAPLSTRKRRKPLRARVCAALSLDEQLYTQALRRAADLHDNNFSGYVRHLLKHDLGLPA